MKGLMKRYKRGLAGFLALCLMVTSFNTAAWAGEGVTAQEERADIVLHLNGQQIKDAAEAAIREGSADEALKITPEKLGITASDLTAEIPGGGYKPPELLEEEKTPELTAEAKKYQKLFTSDKDGDLYEITPEFADSDYMPETAGLRVFIRANATEDYTLTGKEEIIFLFSNGGTEKTSFLVMIGENKLPLVSVKANSDSVIDTENPIEESTEESAETSTDETTENLPTEDGTVENSKAPEISAEADDITIEAGFETESKADTVTPDETEKEQIASDEAQDDNQISEDNSTDQAEEPEAQPAEENDSADEAEPVSVSSRMIPMVAASDDDDYREDVDLIDDGTSTGKRIKYNDNAEVTSSNVTNKTNSANTTAAQPIEIKAVKISGKLYDESVKLEINEDSMMVRAFVTTLNKVLGGDAENDGNKASLSNASPSDATLVVKHAFPLEGGEYQIKEETIQTFASGTGILPEDVRDKGEISEYAKFYLVDKSEPESLTLQKGVNEITVYYKFDASSMATLNYGKLELASNRKARSAAGLPQGQVGAYKDAWWTEDTANYAADILLSVEGEPLKTPVDVILVLDGSASMYNPELGGILDEKDGITRLSVAHAAATSFAKTILDRNTGITDKSLYNRVGVIGFGATNILLTGSVGKLKTELTLPNVGMGRPGGVLQDIDNYRDGALSWPEGTNFKAGLQGAIDTLKKSDDADVNQTGRKTYIIFMSDGTPSPNNIDYRGLKEAEQLKNQYNATIYTVGIGLDKISPEEGTLEAASALLNDLATGSDYFYNVANKDIKDVLVDLFNRIANQVLLAGTDAVITDVLSTDFVIDTSRPFPKSVTYDEATRTLTWKIGDIFKDPKQVKIPVKINPQVSIDAGKIYHTNDSVRLDYTDVNDKLSTKTDFANPALTLSGAIVKVRYSLANKDGQFIDEAGNPIIGEQDKVHTFYQLIEEDSSVITELEKELPPFSTKASIEKDGKQYTTHNDFRTLNIPALTQYQVYTVFVPVYLNSDFPYEVNYYKDAVSANNRIGEAIIGKAKEGTVFWSAVDSAKYPDATYKVNPRIEMNGGDGTVSSDPSKNIVNIIYEKKSVLTVTGPDRTINYGDSAPQLNTLIFTVSDGLVAGDEIIATATKFEGSTEAANAHLAEAQRTKILGTAAVMRNGVDVTSSDYIINIIPGTLTINPLQNTLQVESVGGVYGEGSSDGKYTLNTTAIKNSAVAGSTISYSTDGKTWSPDAPLFENQGTYTVYVKAEKENYIDDIKEAEITISPRPVLLKAKSIERSYKGDGDKLSLNELVGDKYEVMIQNGTYGLLSNHMITDITVGGEATKDDIGKPVASTIKDAVISGTDAKNYSFQYQDGTLLLNKGENNDMTLTGKGGVYNGEAYNVEFLNTPVAGSVLHITVTANGSTWTEDKLPSFTDAGIYEIEYYASHPDYNDTEKKKLTITISARPVYIEGGNLSKVYDGKPLVASDEQNAYSITVLIDNAGLLNGHIAQVEVSGELDGKTAPAVGVITIGNVNIYDGNKDVTSNYDIKRTDGTLKITQGNDLNISAVAFKGVYDGKDHGLTSYEVKDSRGNIITDAELSFSKDGKNWIKDNILYRNANAKVGGSSIKSDMIYIKATHSGYGNTAEISVPVIIEKRPLTVRVESKTFPYDGKAHFWHEYTTREISIADDQKIHVGFSVEVTDVGPAVPNTFTVEVIGAEDDIKINPTKYTDNYEITKEIGTLQITPVDGNVLKVDPATGEYDGKTVYSLAPSAADGSTFKYSLDGGQTEVDAPGFKDATKNMPNAVDGKILVWVQAINKNYNPTEWVQTYIQVSPRQITVTPDSKAVNYTGSKPEAPFTGKVTSGEVVKGDDLHFTYDVDSSYQGQYNVDDDIKLVVTGWNKDNGNYEVTPGTGTLSIIASKTALTVSAESVNTTYDGQKHGLDESKASAKAGISDIEDAKIWYSVDNISWSDTSDVFINAGTYTVFVKATHKNYTDSASVPYTVAIDAKKVTLIPNHVEKGYGEKDPLPFNGIITDTETKEAMDLFGDDDLHIIYGRAKDYEAIEHAGEDVVKLEVTSYDTDNKNYIVTLGENTMTILPAAAPTLQVEPKTADYDAEQHAIGDLKVMNGPEGYLEDKETQITYTYMNDEGKEVTSKEKPSFTEAGTHTVVVTVENPNYGTVTINAELVINKRQITVVPKDVTKVYDGSALKPTEIIISNKPLVDTQKVRDGYVLLGEQTEAGRSNSIVDFEGHEFIIEDANGVDRTANYDISYGVGDVEITPAEVEIVPENPEFTYNSEAHQYPAAKVMYGKLDVTNQVPVEYSIDDGLTWSEKLPEGFVNVTKNPYVVMIRANYGWVNHNYYEVSNTASVTVIPEEIVFTVTPPSDKVYGSKDPKFEGTYTGEIYKNELGEIRYDRRMQDIKKENVGDDIEITAYYNLEPDNLNYVVSVNLAKLNIVPSQGNTLEFDSVTKTYDGKSYGLDNVTATGAGTNKIEYTLTPEDGKSWSETPLTFSDVNIVDGHAAGYKVYVRVTNSNYESVQRWGTVLINPKEVTLKVSDNEKVYGTTDPTMKITGSSDLVQPDDLGTIVPKRITNPDADQTKDPAGHPITYRPDYTPNKNYTVNVEDGTLQVTAKGGLEVNAESDEAVYNATEQPYKGADSTVEDGNTTIWYSKTGNDGDWSTEKPTFKDVANVNGDAVDGYDVFIKATNPNYEDSKVETVTMTIKPADVLVKGQSYSKTYLGADPEFAGEVSGIIAGDSVGIGTVTYTRADASNKNENISTEMNPEITIDISYTPNKNYKVTTQPGKLTITPAQIPMSITGNTVVYSDNQNTVTVSGTDAIAPTLSYTVVKQMNGEELSDTAPSGVTWATEQPDVIDAGTYRVYVKAEKDNYVSVEAYGDIIVKKRPITITAQTAEKMYDGTELTSNDIIVEDFTEGTGLAKDTHEVTSWQTKGSITEVGTQDNTVVENSVVIKSGDTDKTANYEIVREKGTLTVYKTSAKDSITLTAEDKEWTFNNDTHQYPVASSTGPNGMKDESITIEYSTDGGKTWKKEPPKEFLNAGEYTVIVKATSPNYEGEATVEKTVTVLPKAVTITLDKAEKLYGKEDPGFTGTISGLVPGDQTSITETTYGRVPEHADRENVGDVINTYAYFTEDSNYSVTVTGNVLAILPTDGNGANVKSGGGEYNGEEFGLEEVTALQDGSTIWYATSPNAPESEWTTTPPQYTEVGEYPVYIKITNSNYNDTTAEGKIVITARAIVVKADDASKLFDNTSLTKDGAHVVNAEERLVKGHKLSSVTVTGSQTEVGRSSNTTGNDAVITMEDPRLRGIADVTSNYAITYEDGILEVIDNPHAITINYEYHKGEEGDTAALPPTYQNSLSFNTSYAVATQEVSGYVADVKLVEGTMKLEDVTVVVTYHKDDNGNGIPDCEEDKFTITFLPGTNGTLQGTTEYKEILTGTVFGKAVTVPTPAANNRYRFAGWKDVSDSSKELPDENSLITESKTYEAQWTYISSGGGGGGGGTTPGGNSGGDNDHGPGVPKDETTTINPEDVPLAALPPSAPDGNNMTIDDGEIPLASLPKTGEKANGAQFAVILSGLLAGLFLTLRKKKEDENS